jgi:hypothetical protein
MLVDPQQSVKFSALGYGPGLQIEGVLVYFTYLKHQKRIGDDVGDLKYVFTKTKKIIYLF